MPTPACGRGVSLGVAALFGLSAGGLCAVVLLLPMLAGQPPASGLAAYGAALLLLYGVHAGTRTVLRVGPPGLGAQVGAGLTITVIAVAVVGVALYALLPRAGGIVEPARQALGRAGTLAFFGALAVGYGALATLRATRRAQRESLKPDGRSSPRR
jgi:hypothetical protein